MDGVRVKGNKSILANFRLLRHLEEKKNYAFSFEK